MLRLERGEDIHEQLTTFCNDQQIINATITGIGSIENPTLAHYFVDTKKYSEKELPGVFEVTGLLGNVALFEEKPLLHLHITISDEQMRALAGHLVRGTVSATLEIHLISYPSAYEKKHDEEIGLNLFDLPEKVQTHS